MAVLFIDNQSVVILVALDVDQIFFISAVFLAIWKKRPHRSINFTGKVKELDEKLDEQKPIIVAANTQPIQEIMKKGITDMKLTVGTKAQPVVKKFQILLFPEKDAKLFYKIVFGRWFLFLVLMLLIINLYNFSVHWRDN